MHFKNLNAYAFTIVKDEMLAEELVQNVFYKIWERPEKLSIQGSIAAYLYRAHKARSMYQSHALYQ